MGVCKTERSRRRAYDNETKLNTSRASPPPLPPTKQMPNNCIEVETNLCVQLLPPLNLTLSWSLSLSLLLLYFCLLDSAYEWFLPLFRFVELCIYLLKSLSPSLFLTLRVFSLLNVLTSNVWHFSCTLDPRASFELFGEISFLLCPVFY